MCTMRYSSALSRKEILPHATTRTDLEDSRRVKRASPQKTNPARLHVRNMGEVVGFLESEPGVVTAGGDREGKMGNY